MTHFCTQDGVMELCLSQPPMNEIGTQMIEHLERFVDAAEAEPPRAVVLYSALPRGFCAGADLRQLYLAIRDRRPDEYRGALADFIDRIHRVMDRIDMLPCTTIGAVHGACFGGGFELALALDVLVADTTARFCFPELRLGIIPGFGGIPRLSRELPNAVVRDLILTGRSMGARRAFELGLVSQVVSRGEALSVARKTARQAALFERDVVASAKSFMKPLPSAELAAEKQRFLQLFERPAVVDALRGFVERDDTMPYLPLPEA
jgi:enoyl-CoA hydratase/carnithine racemase